MEPKPIQIQEPVSPQEQWKQWGKNPRTRLPQDIEFSNGNFFKRNYDDSNKAKYESIAPRDIAVLKVFDTLNTGFGKDIYDEHLPEGVGSSSKGYVKVGISPDSFSAGNTYNALLALDTTLRQQYGLGLADVSSEVTAQLPSWYSTNKRKALAGEARSQGLDVKEVIEKLPNDTFDNGTQALERLVADFISGDLKRHTGDELQYVVHDGSPQRKSQYEQDLQGLFDKNAEQLEATAKGLGISVKGKPIVTPEETDRKIAWIKEYDSFVRSTAQRAIRLEPGHVIVVPVSEILMNTPEIASPAMNPILRQLSTEVRLAKTNDRDQGSISPSVMSAVESGSNLEEQYIIATTNGETGGRQLHIARLSPELLQYAQEVVNGGSGMSVGETRVVNVGDSMDSCIVNQTMVRFISQLNDSDREEYWESSVLDGGKIEMRCVARPSKVSRDQDNGSTDMPTSDELPS